jgi:branched-chain amino acid transport system substrate-binding protein
MTFFTTTRLRLLGCALALALALPSAVLAADPYEINVVLPLTGPGTFLGKSLTQALEAVAVTVNKEGGIAGRPVKFVYFDDQTNPQVSVQLLNQIVAKKVPVVIGSSLVATCSAMMPIVKNGPVMYCFSPGIHPPPDSYAFSSSFSTPDLMEASIRYFRERGLTRMAVITSTDASGQDAERSLDAAFALPENKSVAVVDREHFNPTDVSVAAQLVRIKATNPQVLIAWTTGTPAGTVLRGVVETALNIPVMTSTGNATYAQMQQYSQILPKEFYVPGVPGMAPDQISDRATKAAIASFYAALNAEGVKPDYVHTAAWDPAMIVIGALKKLGPQASPDAIRRYIDDLKGWVGINGPYDFRAVPQRGLSRSGVVIVRWNAQKDAWQGVSKPGGDPLGR